MIWRECYDHECSFKRFHKLYSLLTVVADCQVFLFGSSVSGVGMHGCDMDIFLDITSDDVVQQNAQSDDKVNCACVYVCVYERVCVCVCVCMRV